jgi:2-polyprenyl-3-methyl-5-hydroxy-6-metoxy-1,4-benzoquinol methylase
MTSASLAVRSRQEEQMDAVELDTAIYARVLADLARVNWWTLTARSTLAFLSRATVGLDSFRLLDVGFGHGDLLRAIARWAGRHGKRAELVGVDLNPRSEAIARAATAADATIDYRTGDYRDQEGPFDFIVSSQVTHHMSDAELLAFIADMEARAERGWLISDLHRHVFSYHGFPLLARLLGVHRIVREDGQLSIARSFRPPEWGSIVGAAGVDPRDVTIARYFPFRLCVERLRAHR